MRWNKLHLVRDIDSGRKNLPACGQLPLRVMAGGSGGGAALVCCPAAAGDVGVVGCLGCGHFAGVVGGRDGHGSLRCSHRSLHRAAVPRGDAL